MRLIDADELVKLLKASTMSNGTLINTNTMLAVVEKMPTAYGVEKVVEQLESTKETSLELVKLPKFLKKYLYELVNMCFDEAIEIVKVGVKNE